MRPPPQQNYDNMSIINYLNIYLELHFLRVHGLSKISSVGWSEAHHEIKYVWLLVLHRKQTAVSCVTVPCLTFSILFLGICVFTTKQHPKCFPFTFPRWWHEICWNYHQCVWSRGCIHFLWDQIVSSLCVNNKCNIVLNTSIYFLSLCFLVPRLNPNHLTHCLLEMQLEVYTSVCIVACPHNPD